MPRFAFDRDQVIQVLWNVALNGVEAMNGRGRLSLEVARQNGDVALAVSDTGPGIPPENLRRVFEPFYSGKPNGSGLGLTIAERIVAAHGGRIEIDSAPGHGTRGDAAVPARGRAERLAQPAGRDDRARRRGARWPCCSASGATV